MKALTICQPFPHLIVTPAVELPAGLVPKRCENRNWATSYRGPLLIHAGKSRDWLGSWPGLASELVFGAIVGVAWLEDCIAMRRVGPGQLECPIAFKRKYRSLGLDLDRHVHCEGPFGLMLLSVRRFPEPIPYSGKQGLFEIPQPVVEPQLRASGFSSRLWTPRVDVEDFVPPHLLEG